MTHDPDRPRVAIIGGGLAGLAAASALADGLCQVDLYEGRSILGGRAASFRDPSTGSLIDHCQHVGMGCCTNLAAFCRRTGVEHLLRRDDVLHFIGPQRQRCTVRASRWLPAPFHLTPALGRMTFLKVRDRLAICRALWRLMRHRPTARDEDTSLAAWLDQQGQSPEAQRQFWGVILTSALGEMLDRISLAAARQVLVEGFMASPDASSIFFPKVPLGEIYDLHLARWLTGRNVGVHLRSTVKRIARLENRWQLSLQNDVAHEADVVIVAVPWRRAGELFDEENQALLPELDAARQLTSSPITAVHLCFDRPITELKHAVLIGRLSQWLFSHGQADAGGAQGYRYQVVISASGGLKRRGHDEIIAEVVGELAAVFPPTAAATLLDARLVTDPQAVFSACPGSQAMRPAQRTRYSNLFLAGDWTATGWPATMESAVRSGYLAAEAAASQMGWSMRATAADLPRGTIARLLIR